MGITIIHFEGVTITECDGFMIIDGLAVSKEQCQRLFRHALTQQLEDGNLTSLFCNVKAKHRPTDSIIASIANLVLKNVKKPTTDDCTL